MKNQNVVDARLFFLEGGRLLPSFLNKIIIKVWKIFEMSVIKEILRRAVTEYPY